MKKTLLVTTAFIAAVVVVGLGYLYFAGGSGEPTTELTAPTLASDTTSQAGPTTSDGPATTDAAGAGTVTLEISSAQSQARFELDEVLQGTPTHVVGTTDQVVGQIRFDPADLSTVEVSTVVINARTLQTDSDRRDRAIRGPVVLNSASDEFELITFEPTSIDGLTGSADRGVTFEFTVAGNLTVKGTTQPATFQVVATWVDPSRIEGSATTTVNRADFGIGIPSVPGVADVSEQVVLGLDFVAEASNS